MNTNLETFELVDWKYRWLVAEIERVNKRSKRCGGGLELVVISERQEETRKPLASQFDFGPDSTYMATFYTLTIEGETPCIEGYTPIAVVDFIPDDIHGGYSQVVRNFKGQELPEEYRSCEPWCDHCKSMRRRNSVTFLKDSDGKYIQVGHNCLADYLRSPELASQLEQQAEFLNMVMRAQDMTENGIDEDAFFGGGGYWVPSLLDWIRWTVAIVNVAGFVSRGKAWESQDTDRPLDSTSDIVLHHIFARNWKPEWYIAIPTPEDREEAEKIIAWAQELETEGNDYLANLKAIACRKALDHKHYGLATSMPTAYARAMEKLREQADKPAKPETEWFGKVGDKIELDDLELVMQRPYESDFGFGCMYKFTDNNGHVFVWFSSSNKDLEDEAHYSLKGSIKKLGEFNQEKQTVLTRCRVKELAVTA